MNKPYFAKYLPVEGEIKEGDMVRNNLDGLIGNTTRPITQPEIDDKEYSKVKLFLCSRDIQVGDKVKCFNYPEQPEREVVNLRTSKKLVGAKDHSEIYHLVDIQYPNEVNTSAVTGFFKVIGEISPDAIWVKEGDKFNENEIEGYYGTGGSIIEEGKLKGKRISITFNWRLDTDDETLERLKIKENPDFRVIYKIKGPCGHFH